MSKRILCLALALCMAVSLHIPAFAASEEGSAPTVSASRMVRVTDYGADGSDADDDTRAIQKALNLGKDATADSPVTVIVPAGTYYIKHRLYIYSNTTLSLDPEAEIIRTNERTQMLVSGYINSDIGGYEQLKNVTVTGGVWDGNVETDADGKGLNAYNMFFLWHGDNITISNTTLKNCCGDHFIELSGVANSRVENVTFQDFIKYVGTDYDFRLGDETVNETAVRSEALQLDYTTYGNSTPALPYDGTVCRNITVTGCRFINCLAGVGSHHSRYQAQDISITGNRFEYMESVCVDLPNMANVTVSNNTASNVRAFFRASHGSSDITVSNNTVTYGYSSVSDRLRQDCFYIENASVTLRDNRVYGCGNRVVWGAGASSRIAVENNIFDLSSIRWEEASAVQIEGATVTASGNAVIDAAQNGFYLLNATGTLANNLITGCGQSGIRLGSTVFQVIGNTIDSGSNWAVQISDSGTRSSGAVRANSITGRGIDNRSSGKIKVEDNSQLLPTPVLTGMTAVNGGAHISWNEVAGAAGYRVFFRIGGGSWQKIGDTDATDFLWTGAERGVSYTFTVRCLNDNGNYASAYDQTGLSLAVAPLPAPQIVRVSNTAAGVEISWTAVEDAAAYRVLYRAGGGEWQEADDTDATSFLWADGVSGTTYSFSVCCLDAGGTCVSPYSDGGMSITVSSIFR